jgi:hypothetical protein
MAAEARASAAESEAKHRALLIEKLFCSAFVVACYSVVGIIGESAQVAYQPHYVGPRAFAWRPLFWLGSWILSAQGRID